MPAENRGVAYIKPGEVQIQGIDFPKLVNPTNGNKTRQELTVGFLPVT